MNGNGPTSPSVLANMIMTLERHVDLIADCISYMRENDFEGFSLSKNQVEVAA